MLDSMDDKNQKERLEQELKFLKESFEAEVISKEEFEKGRDRIERKLRDIEKETKQSQTDEKEVPENKQEAKDEAIEAKTPEKIKLRVIQDDPFGSQYTEPVKQSEKKEEPKKEAFEPETAKEPKKESKLFKYAIVFIVLLLAGFFAYSFIKSNAQKTPEKIIQAKSEENPKINVVVLNDRANCFNCDTGRIMAILESWFGALNAKEIDYSTAEGKNIAQKLDANALPMYILDGNITKKENYAQLKRAFIRKNDSYILSDDVAAPAFYAKRQDIQKKLDLFVIEGDNASIKAEKNLKEFLNAFSSVMFERHAQKDNLTKELGIKNFPAFLVNNRVKFSGVHTAETIKANFCKLNKLDECNKGLSKNLV